MTLQRAHAVAARLLLGSADCLRLQRLWGMASALDAALILAACGGDYARAEGLVIRVVTGHASADWASSGRDRAVLDRLLYTEVARLAADEWAPLLDHRTPRDRTSIRWGLLP